MDFGILEDLLWIGWRTGCYLVTSFLFKLCKPSLQKSNDAKCNTTMPSQLSCLTAPTALQPSRFHISVKRRRQLTRALTCQSCPVNLSHLHTQVRLLLNSLCDMLLAVWMAWLTAVLILVLGGASVDVLDMIEGDWGGHVRSLKDSGRARNSLFCPN